jgi:hypothetical protein
VPNPARRSRWVRPGGCSRSDRRSLNP